MQALSAQARLNIMRILLTILILIASSQLNASEEALGRLQKELAIFDWQLGNSVTSDAATLYVDRALTAAGNDPNYYMGRARSFFAVERYSEAISSLDIFMALQGETINGLLLRALAKKSLSVADLAGACTDFMTLNSYGFDLSVINGIDQDCRDQDGWLGR